MGKQKICKIPFSGTEEQEKQLRAVIEAHKEQQGALMPVLQEAQSILKSHPLNACAFLRDFIWLNADKTASETAS